MNISDNPTEEYTHKTYFVDTSPIHCKNENCENEVNRDGKECQICLSRKRKIESNNRRIQKMRSPQYVSKVLSQKRTMNKRSFENKKARLKDIKFTKKPDKTYSELIKNIDAVFSKLIRLSACDWKEDVKCFTCSNVFNWKEVDNGHYIVRAYMGTRWEVDNCKPQCKTCNQMRGGMVERFKQNLISLIGWKKYNRLLELKNEVQDFSIPELKQKHQFFKSEIKRVCLEKKIQL